MHAGPAPRIRTPAVAGRFYPGDAGTLSQQVAALLGAVPDAAPPPKALIVPHAGYVYSGPVAASAYALLRGCRRALERVVLLGPSHHVPLRCMAVPSVDAFDTPLGRVPLDRAAVAALAAMEHVRVWDAPHEMDHALEVQLPFLQAQLGDFALVPLAVGPCAPARVAAVLDAVWGGPETLVVVSTDMSHFHRYEQARAIDRDTAAAILRRETSLSGEQACGCHAVNGLLHAARERGLEVELLDQRNSGDTAGDRARVVGYASFALREH